MAWNRTTCRAKLRGSGWNFAGQDLTGANFTGQAGLRQSEFHYAGERQFYGPTVANADFGNTTANGFTVGQLASTASYTNQNLQGIGLESNNLSGWDFSNQHLTTANFTGATSTAPSSATQS